MTISKFQEIGLWSDKSHIRIFSNPILRLSKLKFISKKLDQSTEKYHLNDALHAVIIFNTVDDGFQNCSFIAKYKLCSFTIRQHKTFRCNPVLNLCIDVLHTIITSKLYFFLVRASLQRTDTNFIGIRPNRLQDSFSSGVHTPEENLSTQTEKVLFFWNGTR